MSLSRATLLPLVLAVAIGSVTTRADDAPAAIPSGPERALADALARIAAGDLDDAQARLDALVTSEPGFRLAQLALGDVLMARAGGLARFGDAAGAPADARADLEREAALRLAALTDATVDADAVPAALVRLAPRERHAIVVDTQRARVYVWRAEGTRLVRVADFYASHGKQGVEKLREGDKRTPTGVYRVVGWLSPERLADMYGAGAFPIDYPNAWDKRAGRGGSGIWLHGTPTGTYARAPRASDGCVVLANADLAALARYVDTGDTPVVIEDGVRMVSAAALAADRAAIEESIESWRSDWQSLDVDRYLAHYAAEFQSGDGKHRAAWDAHKRRVAAARNAIDVRIDGLSILREGTDLAVVTFDQDYRSDGYSGSMRKRQYWVREDGGWRIGWEGDVADDAGNPMRGRGTMLSRRGAPEPTNGATSP